MRDGWSDTGSRGEVDRFLHDEGTRHEVDTDWPEGAIPVGEATEMPRPMVEHLSRM
jgi:hypothetical protein